MEAHCITPILIIKFKEKIDGKPFELTMLSVGDSEPPKSWQNAFKITPETDEERYSRLTGVRKTRQGPGGEVTNSLVSAY